MKIDKAVLAFLVLISVACAVGAAPDNASGGKDIATRLSFPYSQGWLGGDDAYSIPFAPGKSIWLFGDTFAGDVSNMDRSKTTMVRNSVGVTSCVPEKPCAIQYYWKNQNAANPRSFFDTGKEDEWYWPMDGYLDGETL